MSKCNCGSTWHAGIGLCAEFIERIEFLANRAALTPAEVYAMWRKYAQQCDWADQSAILSEFEDWNKEALAPAPKLEISEELVKQAAIAGAIIARERRLGHRLTSDFNEADCGGAFDGNQVTSDADPGL